MKRASSKKSSERKLKLMDRVTLADLSPGDRFGVGGCWGILQLSPTTENPKRVVSADGKEHSLLEGDRLLFVDHGRQES
jgi:hypothetical protein